MAVQNKLYGGFGKGANERVFLRREESINIFTQVSTSAADSARHGYDAVVICASAGTFLSCLSGFTAAVGLSRVTLVYMEPKRGKPTQRLSKKTSHDDPTREAGSPLL